MTNREEFEAWILNLPNASKKCLNLAVDEDYDEYWVSQRWVGWQAAKAQDRDVMQQALRALESLFTVDGVGIWKLGGQSLPKSAIAELKKALGKS